MKNNSIRKGKYYIIDTSKTDYLVGDTLKEVFKGKPTIAKCISKKHRNLDGKIIVLVEFKKSNSAFHMGEHDEAKSKCGYYVFPSHIIRTAKKGEAFLEEL